MQRERIVHYVLCISGSAKIWLKALLLPLLVSAFACAVVVPACSSPGGQQPYLAPGWDIAMRAGNMAAMRGDMTTALREWSTLHYYTKDRCMLESARINVDAAKRTLRDIRLHNLARQRRFTRYVYYREQQWQGNPCNR